MLTHGILTAIPTSYFFSHSLAPFIEHPVRHRVLESPLQSWQPRNTVLAFLQLLSLRFTLDIFPCVECRIHHNREFSPKIQRRVIGISKVLQSLTRRESRDYFPHVTYGMQGTLHHGWQPQITMSDDPYLIGPGLSTHTHSTVN